MPLPSGAFNIRGGCNCRAVRFEIRVPALDDRPRNNYAAGPGGDEQRFPTVVADHCNNCRRATASMLPIWLCTPAPMMTVSLLKDTDRAGVPDTSRGCSNFASDAGAKSHETVKKPVDYDKSRRGPWLPAADVLWPGKEASKASPFVRFYESSGGTTRTFCGRCGTMLTYARSPMPAGWPDMFDVLVATFDRETLANDWLMPEHHLWWDMGIDWIKRFVLGAARNVPIHPLSNMSVNIKVEDFEQAKSVK